MVKQSAKTKAIETTGAEIYRGVNLTLVRSTSLLGYLDANKVQFKPVPVTKDDPFAPVKAAIDAYADHIEQIRRSKIELLHCEIEEGGCGAYSAAYVVKDGKQVEIDTCPVCGQRDPNEQELAQQNAKTEQEIELDAAMDRVSDLTESVIESFWDLGNELKVIEEKKLYLARRVPGTHQPAYKSFEDFLKHEQFRGKTLTSKSLRYYMLVAKTFDRETAVQIGVGKLQLIASAKPENREELLDLAKKGAGGSLRKIKEEVQALKLNGTAPRPRPQLSVGGGGEAARAPSPEASGAVSVTFQMGTNELKLSPGPRNTLIAREELLNGVVIDYSLNPKTNVLKITRARKVD